MDAIGNRWSAWGAIALSLFVLAGCRETGPAPVATTQIMAIDTPPPVYPAELACNDVGGQVLLQLTIGAEGRPTEVRMLQGSGEPALDAAAQEAVRNWRFKAATRADQPVAGKLDVPVTFTPPKVKPPSCLVLQEQRGTR